MIGLVPARDLRQPISLSPFSCTVVEAPGKRHSQHALLVPAQGIRSEWGGGAEVLSSAGEGKGWMAVGRMSLTGLRFLDSRRIPSAGASSRKLNNINAPSAIRSDLGFRPLHIVP